MIAHFLMALLSTVQPAEPQPQASNALGTRMEEYKNCVSGQIREEALRQYRTNQKLTSDKLIADFAIKECAGYSEQLRIQMAEDLKPLFPEKSPDEIDRLASEGVADFNKTTMKTFARAFVRDVRKEVIKMVEEEEERARNAQN